MQSSRAVFSEGLPSSSRRRVPGKSYRPIHRRRVDKTNVPKIEGETQNDIIAGTPRTGKHTCIHSLYPRPVNANITVHQRFLTCLHRNTNASYIILVRGQRNATIVTQVRRFTQQPCNCTQPCRAPPPVTCSHYASKAPPDSPSPRRPRPSRSHRHRRRARRDYVVSIWPYFAWWCSPGRVPACGQKRQLLAREPRSVILGDACTRIGTRRETRRIHASLSICVARCRGADSVVWTTGRC